MAGGSTPKKKKKRMEKDARPPKNHVVRERKRRDEIIKLMMNEKCKEKVELASLQIVFKHQTNHIHEAHARKEY